MYEKRAPTVRIPRRDAYYLWSVDLFKQYILRTNLMPRDGGVLAFVIGLVAVNVCNKVRLIISLKDFILHRF